MRTSCSRACFLCLFFLTSFFTKAQTTLSPGDIAIVGYDFSYNTTTTAPIGSDNFDIVVLKNVSAGTVVNFTSNGWTGSAFSSVGTIDGFFTWTVGSNIVAGTVLNFSIANSTLPATVTVSPSNGTISGVTSTEFTSTVGFSPSTGNQILIFQGTQAAPTFIYGINTNATNVGAGGWVTGTVANNAAQSALPTGLTNANPFNGTVSAPSALPFTLETARYNAVYSGPLVGSQTTLLTDIGNYANWTATATATAPYDLAVGGANFSSSNPVFDLGTAPSITGQPSSTAICAGSNTSFGVTANNATSYQWQVNTGSGFNNITNGGVYSNATTTTLTITGATAAMTGYTYRAVVTGTTSPVATSNASTLTVSSITTSGVQTNISCNSGSNGTATVTPSGGIASYTYSWSPSGGTGATASGLVATTYTVTVSDNIGCTATKNFTITQPTALAASTSQTNIACNGGTTGAGTVTPTGGTTAYSYSWSPSGGTGATATGLSIGTYTITITDANSCTLNKNITITQPTAITASTSQTNVACNGGTTGIATVNPSGGTGTNTYTYSWSPSGGTGATATGLGIGVYTATITDANLCSIHKNITITQPTAITASTSQVNASCAGNDGSATVTPTGGAGAYTYAWAPSGGAGATATGLASGNYAVTITDANSCSITKNYTITGTIAGQWLGTSDSNWSNTANWSCGTLPTTTTNVTISSNAPNMPVVDIPNAVCNSLTINSGASVSITTAGNNLAIYGALSNNGTYTNTSGKTTFAGSMQNIPQGDYDNLEITGTGTKTLAGPVTVNGTLTLNAGYLKLGNNDLLISSTGNIASGTSSSNYIITNGSGSLKEEYIGTGAITGNVLFPVGTTSSYTPVYLTNAGTADVFGIKVLDSVSSTYDNSDSPTGTTQLTNSVNKTWLVTEGTSGGSNVTLTFQWNSDDEQNGFIRGSCMASHYYNNKWNPDVIGSASGTGPYTRSLSNITSFSPFAVGNVGTVLPLNLLSFTGKTNASGNLLTWATSTEVNVASFSIERSSDATHFASIGTLAAGQQQYQFTDNNASASLGYFYRLKIIDNDGSFKYSVVLHIDGTNKQAYIYTIYPNPVTGSILYITTQSTIVNKISVSISDVLGKQWYNGTLEAAALNNGKATIDVSTLVAGSYFIQLRDEKTNAVTMLKFEK